MKQSNIDVFLRNNSSTILTVVGSIGVGVTAIMSGRDTLRAKKRINYQRGYQDKEFNTKEKIKIAAPCYIPTIISGLSTILCICGVNKINKNMQKSLTSAYILLDRSYKEYRNSVRELYGESGDLDVIENIADKKAEETPITRKKDSDIFFDFFSLHFFNASLSAIRNAEKEANEILKSRGYVSLSTLYSLIGEDVHGTDNLLGWSIGAGNLYNYDSIQIKTDEMTREDGSKYYILDFVDAPTEDYLMYI